MPQSHGLPNMAAPGNLENKVQQFLDDMGESSKGKGKGRKKKDEDDEEF